MAKPRPVHTFFRYFPVHARDRRWGLWVTTVGMSHVPAHSDYPPTSHPGGYQFGWPQGRRLREFQIVYISAGRGVLQTRRHSRRVICAGDTFVLFPGLWHTYRPDRETGWDEHWIGCDGPFIRSLVKNGFFSARKPVLRTRGEELLLGAFASAMDAIRTNGPALQQTLAGTTAQILSQLYAAQKPRQGIRHGMGAAIQDGMRLMAGAPAREDAGIEWVARDLKVSYTSFRRHFTQQTGLSPHQYRLQLKIGRARTYLRDTTLTVKEIAYRCGFHSAHYFCRLFRKKAGMTPRQWRRLSAR